MAPDVSKNYYFANTYFNVLGTHSLSVVDSNRGNVVISRDISINVVPSPVYTPQQYVLNGNAFVLNYTSYSLPTRIGHQYQLINSTHGNTVLASFTAGSISNTYTFGDGVSSVVINDLSVNLLSILDASYNNRIIANQNIQLISYTPYYTPTQVDVNRPFTLNYTDISNVPINTHVYYLIDLPSMTLVSTFTADSSSNSYVFTDLSYDTITTKTFQIYDFTGQRSLTTTVAVEITPLPYYMPTDPIQQDTLFTLYFHTYSIPMIPGHQYQLINTSDGNRVLSTISSPVSTYEYFFENGYNGVFIHRLGTNVLSILDFTTGETIYDQTIEVEIFAPPPAEVVCSNSRYFGYANRDSRMTCSAVLYSKVDTGGNNPRISSRMRYSQLVQK
jgi:hypothetical protein